MATVSSTSKPNGMSDYEWQKTLYQQKQAAASGVKEYGTVTKKTNEGSLKTGFQESLSTNDNGAGTGTGTDNGSGTVKPKTGLTGSGSGSGGGTSSAAPATTAAADVAPSKSVDRTLQDQNYQAYLQAMDTLAQASSDAPGYTNQYEGQINDAYSAIVNRSAFNYNLNEDQMYQQYRDQYMANAQLSMMDTIGQAAGLTGGYGSSYGQAVGQQAYDAQLQQLNDVVPDLYNSAYQQYQDEGDQLTQNYQMLLNREADDYSRYQDDLSQWNANRDYLTDAADTAYNKWLTERDYQDNQEQLIKQEQQNNLNKLLQLAALGYNPTAQEIADAGVTQSQWATYKKSVTSSGGGGSGSSAKSSYNAALEAAKNAILGGKSVEDVNSSILHDSNITVADKRNMIAATSAYANQLRNYGK